MWILGRHRHLNPERLSEFLDGRLDSRASEKVSHQLDNCLSCRDELESLRSTVSMAQALPELSLPRSFTMAAPPPEYTPVRQPLPLRAPGWAYAGAASMAGLALAVMVSADSLGLLSPSNASRSEGATTLSAQPSSSPEMALATPTVSAQAEAASAQDAVPMATTQPTEKLREPTGVQPAMVPPAGTTQPDTMALSAEAEAGQENLSLQAEGQAEPPSEDRPGTDGTIESLANADRSILAATPEQMDDAQAQSRSMLEAQILTEPESEQGDLTLAQYEGTPVVWRVLEGLATLLFLSLLAALVMKRVRSRQTTG